jgi:predicted glycosyltransferase
MRYLIFTNTPAHIHLYRNAVAQLRDRGHDVLVLARDYGCTVELAEWYDLPYKVYGRCDTTKYSLFRQLPSQYASIMRQTRAFDPDLIFGMGAYAAHAGAVSRTRTVLLTDSEPTSLDHIISRPFADVILTPAAFRKDLGSKHYVFDGFKETAYLHPETVSHDPSVRSDLGVGDDDFVILRFNAFGSHHDVSHGGFSMEECQQLIERLAESATVFVSDEGGDMDLSTLPARLYDLHPARLHDALAEASLLVADTQTMVTESALLGTPTIRSNSFVGEDDMGNFIELGQRNLVYNLESFEEVCETATRLLTSDGVERAWQRRRDHYLDDKANLTDIIVDVATTNGAVEQLDSLSRWAGSEQTTAVSGDGISVKS